MGFAPGTPPDPDFLGIGRGPCAAGHIQANVSTPSETIDSFMAADGIGSSFQDFGSIPSSLWDDSVNSSASRHRREWAYLAGAI